VIAADRQHSGTNALLVRERALRRFEFRFGPKSFLQHHESNDGRLLGGRS
jgi:2-phospho-L-lactate guanylyltransferase (CobY/MobA/RfbA family)